MIEFIPWASFPNKAAYKMSPNQNKEIARQVQELLSQGLIKKRISLCAIPVVLGPKKGGKWRKCTNSKTINMITIRC